MDCLFLYNPESGKGKIGKKLPYIERELGKVFDRVVMRQTQSGDDAELQAREGAKQFGAIVFAGGDGTFHRVLQGVEDRPVTLGYLPAGTVNDAARSLGIPRNLKGALKTIAEGNTRRADCMLVNGKSYAVYIVAAGSFCDVTYETSQRSKRILGWFAYFFGVVKRLFKTRTYPVRVYDGEKVWETEGILTFVMNGRWVARFPVNKNASMQDGELEIAVVHLRGKPNGARRFRALFSVASLLLFGCTKSRKYIERFRCKRVEIGAADEIVWDLDGEEGPKGSVTVEVLPGRMKLFVPVKAKI